MATNRTEWKHELANRCDLLLRLYRHIDNKGKPLPLVDRKHILAALYYVCNPHDVIRDSSLEDGFADDALVVLRAVDAERVGLAGYSQGGWVAPIAATLSDDVAFLVLGETFLWE